MSNENKRQLRLSVPVFFSVILSYFLPVEFFISLLFVPLYYNNRDLAEVKTTMSSVSDGNNGFLFDHCVMPQFLGAFCNSVMSFVEDM